MAGKGSTVALLTSVLRAAGLKVGCYTSPHLSHISERISTTPRSHLSAADFSHLVSGHRGVLEQCLADEGGRLSHFEAVTALAFRCGENLQSCTHQTAYTPRSNNVDVSRHSSIKTVPNHEMFVDGYNYLGNY